METWQVLLLILAALVTGPAILALLELRTTLRDVRKFLDVTGTRLNRTLDEASESLRHINRAGQSVEELTSSLRQAGSLVNRITAAASAFFPAALAAWSFVRRGRSGDVSPLSEDEPVRKEVKQR